MDTPYRLFRHINTKSTDQDDSGFCYIKARSIDDVKRAYTNYAHYLIVDVTDGLYANEDFSGRHTMEAFLMDGPEGTVWHDPKVDEWKIAEWTIRDFSTAEAYPRPDKTYGDRVGAVLSSNDGVFKFLGWGVYECDCPPKEAVGWLADSANLHNRPNPRILLDSGKCVYGCECWWGSAERVQKAIDYAIADGYTVVDVDIDEVRAQCRAEAEATDASEDHTEEV